MSDWPLVLLDSIAERGSGHTPSQKHPEYWDGGVKWVSLADCSALDRCFIYDTTKKISDLGIRHSSAVLHPRGTVILSRDASVGKSAILGDEMAVSQHFIAWRCDENYLLPKYLYQWLQWKKPEFERIAIGSTVKTIGLRYFEKLKIPQPPLIEQKAIAHILEDWDTAIETTERLIAAKEAYIGIVTASLYRRKPGWIRHRIGDFLQETKVLHGDGDYVIGSVGKNGIKPRNEVYSKNLTSNIERNLLVKPGWLCFGLASDCMAFGVNSTNQTYSVSPAYRTFQIQGADPRFFEGYLRVFNVRLSKRLLITSARQGKAIDFEGLFNTECYLPSLEEQRQIASAVVLMQEELNRLRRLLDSLNRQKRGLMQKLLTGEWRVPYANASAQHFPMEETQP